MNVFVDTNVLLDVLVAREPFYADSAAIWTLAERGKIRGLVSAISFTNIYYIVRRLSQAQTAQQAVSLLRDTFSIAVCDDRILVQAIDAGFKDFEDAVQYVSALHSMADCFVTRNPDHFPASGQCPVQTPAEFLAAYAFEP